MKVYLHELSEDTKHLHYDERDAWFVDAIKDTQEADSVKEPAAYNVDFDLRKSHGVVFMKGKLRVDLGLLCSRCANGFKQNLSASFQCLFTRERDLAEEKPSGGIAYSEPTGQTGEDLDIEFLDKDYIELADVLKEQIYLKLPIQPLCKESCKGICPVCGQDQNTQPCQCHRIKNTALANALKNFRIGDRQ